MDWRAEALAQAAMLHPLAVVRLMERCVPTPGRHPQTPWSVCRPPVPSQARRWRRHRCYTSWPLLHLPHGAACARTSKKRTGFVS